MGKQKGKPQFGITWFVRKALLQFSNKVTGG